MSLIIPPGGDYTANSPLIGYENLATVDNIAATSEDADYPATNLVNPATNLLWKGEAASPLEDVYVTVTLAGADLIDYVAIAKHNLFTAQSLVSVEGLTGSPLEWVELCSAVALPDNGPAMFCFSEQALDAVRLKIQASPLDVVPQAAVLYAGKLLILQRRVYVGHVPIPYGTSATIVNGKSESGNFLGRIVLNEWNSTGLSLQNLTPAWVRASLMPFVRACKEQPFFFAWRPSSYPYEVGYCWMTNDPKPSNQSPNGMMQVEFNMSGIA
jgi:hypothetical protein